MFSGLGLMIDFECNRFYHCAKRLYSVEYKIEYKSKYLEYKLFSHPNHLVDSKFPFKLTRVSLAPTCDLVFISSQAISWSLELVLNSQLLYSKIKGILSTSVLDTKNLIRAKF